MPTYKNFDQIINSGRPSRLDRINFTKSWLRNNYNITEVKEDFLDNLSDVHDHDNLAKHFGQIRIGTAFSSVTAQIVKVENTWHLGVILKEGGQGQVLHPKSEASYSQVDNMKSILLLKTIVAKGTVSKEVTYLTDTAASDESNGTMYGTTMIPSEIYAAKDAADSVSDDVVSVQSNPNDINIGKTKSVGIDMSAYL